MIAGERAAHGARVAALYDHVPAVVDEYAWQLAWVTPRTYHNYVMPPTSVAGRQRFPGQSA